MIFNKKIYLIFVLLISYSNLFAQKDAITQFGNSKSIVYDFCFSKNGSMIVIPENNIINIYNTNTKQLLYKLEGGHKGQILSVDISPDSSMIISGGKDSLLILWDIKTQKKIKELCYHKGVVTSVKFSPQKNFIASGSSDNTVVLYDVATNNKLYTFSEHTADVSSVSFNSYGTILASASEDKTIIFRNTETGEFINKITKHKSFIREINFSPDNTRFISCDDNSLVYIWKVENINKIIKLRKLKLGHNWILSANFDKSNIALVIGGLDGKLRFETSFYKKIYNLKRPIQKALFIPDNKALIKIAVATRGRGLFIIDTSK